MRTNLNLFFAAVFLVAIVSGWEWPYIAKLMPVYVAAIPGLILVLIQLYRDATNWDAEGRVKGGGIEMDEVYEAKLDEKTEFRRTVIFFAWFVGGALGIWLIGIVFALPILVFFYALIDGKEKWIASLILGICTYLVVWGLFEYLLEARWPPGALFR
jgi:hypothetical protein